MQSFLLQTQVAPWVRLFVLAHLAQSKQRGQTPDILAMQSIAALGVRFVTGDKICPMK